MKKQNHIEQKYSMDEILGEGGSGIVYLGRNESGEKVVIKQFKNSILDIHAQSWKREIETLKLMNHPRIPKYLDYFDKLVEKRRLPHLVMEYIEGENLKNVIKEHRFTHEELVDILKQILLLLSYIHSFQPSLIHRDIKPSNLLRQKNGDLVLIDFGIAVDDVHQTLGRTMGVGTLGYQAPEQVNGEPTVQSDLYSVGVIAVELFTRISPKNLLTQRGVLDWQRKCLDLPIGWQRWLDRMLMEDPSGRFISAEQAIQNIPEFTSLEQDKIEQEKKRAAVHVTNVESANDFLKALQQEAKEHRMEELAEEEKERQKQLEQERLIKERQLEKERQEAEIRHKKQEEKRKKQERKEAIENYTAFLEEEISIGWDGLIQMFAREEIPIERGLSVFLEQFNSKMVFVYNDEKIDINIVEFELARTFPMVEKKVDASYRQKKQKRIEDRLQNSESYREEEQKIEKWNAEIEVIKAVLKTKQQEIDDLMFFEKWIGEDDTLEKEMVSLESEIQNTRNHIENIQKKRKQYIEQQLQTYLFDWEVVPDGYYENLRKERIRKEKERIRKEKEKEKKRKQKEQLEKVRKENESVLKSNKLTQKFVFDEVLIPYSKGEFYVMTTQVTQKLWKDVTEKSPCTFLGNNFPVNKVSWLDCVIFANLLSEYLGLEKVYKIPKNITLGMTYTSRDQAVSLSKQVEINTKANGYRLPTKAEWNYAAKGGKSHTYSGSDNIDEVGWYKKNSNGKIHPVAKKKANGYGLYDMSGNVFEWCWDPYEKDSPNRLTKGGNWDYDVKYCKLTYLTGHCPSRRYNVVGVRLFRSVSNAENTVTEML